MRARLLVPLALLGAIAACWWLLRGAGAEAPDSAAAAAAVPLGSSGTWSLTLDGSNGLPGCAEGSSRWSNTRTGIF